MTRKKILMLLGSVCLALMMLAIACAAPSPSPSPSPTPTPSPTPPPTQEVFEWKYCSINPLTTATVQDLPIIQKIEAMSGGRIKITPYWVDELIPAAEMNVAVSTGTIEMAQVVDGYWDALDIGELLTGLPRAWDSVLAIAWLWYPSAESGRVSVTDLAREAYAEFGIWYSSVIPAGPMDLTSKEPIRSLADIKGKKIRAYGVNGEFLDLLGASSTYITYAEIYMAAATGTIDALSFGSGIDLYNLGMGELYDYINKGFFYDPLTVSFIVNMDAYNALPDDLKVIVDTVCREGGWQLWAGQAGDELMYIDMMGMEIVTWPPEDIATATDLAKQLWDKQAQKSPRAKQFVDLIYEYNRTMGYID